MTAPREGKHTWEMLSQRTTAGPPGADYLCRHCGQYWDTRDLEPAGCVIPPSMTAPREPLTDDIESAETRRRVSLGNPLSPWDTMILYDRLDALRAALAAAQERIKEIPVCVECNDYHDAGSVCEFCVSTMKAIHTEQLAAAAADTKRDRLVLEVGRTHLAVLAAKPRYLAAIVCEVPPNESVGAKALRHAREQELADAARGANRAYHAALDATKEGAGG